MEKRFSTDGKTFDQREMMELIEELDPIHDPLFSRRDDISLSRLFAEILKDHARYNTTAKEWFFYDGTVWKMDLQSLNLERLAKIFGRCLEIYAIRKRSESDKESESENVSKYVDYYQKLGTRANRKKLIEDSRDFYPVEANDFDRDPYLFNCQNCVINLRTLETMDHSPDLLLSKVSNVVYDPEAESPDFEKFISEIMMSNAGKIDYLKRIFGYSLTGENTQEEAYLCFGSTTRNGKSTLLDTIGYMFGDYGMNIEPESLAMRDRNSRGASGDLARLNGCRFLHMSEPPKRMKFDVGLLKKLLGRDTLTVRNLYEREFQFVPVFKLIVNTNYLPIVADDTIFSSGRLKVIPFDRHFEPEEQDVHLRRKLKSQTNISGIFNWCLDGLREYQEDGEILIEPEDVRRATQEYREHSDKIANFLEECLVEDPEVNTSAKDVYSGYTIWCRENGYGVEGKANFLDELRAKDLLSKSGTVNGVTQKNVVKGYDIEYNLKREIFTGH